MHDENRESQLECRVVSSHERPLFVLLPELRDIVEVRTRSKGRLMPHGDDRREALLRCMEV